VIFPKERADMKSLLSFFLLVLFQGIQCLKDSRPALFLLGDSTGKEFCQKYYSFHCKQNIQIHYEEAKPDSQNQSAKLDFVSDAWTCDKGLFSVVGYFIHWGVGTAPYHDNYKYHRIPGGFPGQEVDKLNTTLSMMTALSRFIAHTREYSPRLSVVFTSNLWDARRKIDHFDTLSNDIWRGNYTSDFQKNVLLLKQMLYSYGRADQLFLTTRWMPNFRTFENMASVESLTVIINDVTRKIASKFEIELLDDESLTHGLTAEEYLRDKSHQNDFLNSKMVKEYSFRCANISVSK
jgi:hypothetical protein